MSLSNSDITRVLRAQAWERAKGELKSMLCTYHSPDDARDGQFAEIDALIEQFIDDVERKDLQQ